MATNTERHLTFTERTTDAGYIQNFTVTGRRGKLVVKVQLEYVGSSTWVVRVDRGRGYGRPRSFRDNSAASAHIAQILEKTGVIH